MPRGRARGAVKRGDVAKARVRTTLKGPPLGFGGLVLAFSPDGKTLACGSSGDTQGVVTLWDLASKKRATLQGPQKPITALAFAPDGRTLASAHQRGVVKPWAAEGKGSTNPSKSK